MIIISCRIMIAIRLRSTMEFGRRISTATQKQMKQERTLTNTSFSRYENPTSERKTCASEEMSIMINPLDSSNKKENNQFDEVTDDNDSLCQFNSPKTKSYSVDKTHFRFSQITPIKILFPSLSSITENNKRKNEDLSKRLSCNKTIKNSLSVSNNMKYYDRQLNKSQLSRNVSTTSSFSDESPTKTTQQQISIPNKEIIV